MPNPLPPLLPQFAAPPGGRGRMARWLAVVGVVAALAVVGPAALATEISQGYQSATPLDAGSLVSIDPVSNKVTAADSQNSSGLLGVVVGRNSATLAINNTGTELQIATSGSSNLFVTDLNGPVKVGDQIAPSPIKGVGMLATATGKVVGVAQAALDTKHPLQSVKLTTTSGVTKTANIGVIPVVVQVVYYTAPEKAPVPAFLQQFADDVAGKPVALARLALSSILVLVALAVVAILLFSAVRGAIVSIGRNPLARASVYRGLFQAAGVALAILALAIGGAYVVLLY